MTDAPALNVAQMIAPPRPPQSAPPDSSDDSARDDSDFGTVLQSSVDTRSNTLTKSSTARSADDSRAFAPQSTRPSDDSSKAGDDAAKPDPTDNAVTGMSKPAGNSKLASQAKAEKSDGKADSKSDEQTGDPADASVLLALQAQQNMPQPVPTETPKSSEPSTSAPTTPSDASQSSATPATNTAQTGTAAPPLSAEIAAALAQALTTAPSAAATTNESVAGPTVLAEAAAPAAGTPEPNTQSAETKSGDAKTATSAQAKMDALKAAFAKAMQPVQPAAPTAQDSASNAASPLVVEQAAAAPPDQSPKSSAPSDADPADAQKKIAQNDAAATANADALLGNLAAAGAPNSKPATPASSDDATSETSDGKPAASAIDAASSATIKAALTDKALPAVPDGAASKSNATPQTPFELNAKDSAAAQQPASATPTTTGSVDANAALTNTQSAATPQGAQQAPVQPAAQAPPQGQPQNQAFITANIVQTTATPSNATPTLHAQMDGPRLTLPIDQIALEIRRHSMAGADHFNIKIDPPELGRIDVKIEMTSDGQTKAHLTADRQDTLDLLRRDSGNLERALNSNGLRTDKDSLNFSLRQDNQMGRGGNGTADSGSQGRNLPANTYYGSEEDLVDVAPVYARIVDPTRVDILI